MGARTQRYLLAGIVTVIPILVTYWIMDFLVRLLISFGRPFVTTFALVIQPRAPDLAEWLLDSWVQSVIALVIVLVGLYVLGAIASAVIGRRLIALFDGIMSRIPLAKSIYGAVRKLVVSLSEAPATGQRVVLIDFPSPEMKALGLVTRTFTDADTGDTLAAVYVPTTPNPTSGYLEIVPVTKLIYLDWSTNEAMTFVMSGGAVSRDRINYARSAAIPPPAPQSAPDSAASPAPAAAKTG